MFLLRFSSAYGAGHVEAVHWLLRYIRGTTSFGVMLGLESADCGFEMRASADADHAGCLDTWRPQRQSLVAQSTVEAEYTALAQTSREVIYLRGLLHQSAMTIRKPTPIFEDNEVIARLAKNPEFHERTRHISVKYHLVRDLVELQVVDIVPIRSNLQLADIFTKPLMGELFVYMRAAIGVLAAP